MTNRWMNLMMGSSLFLVTATLLLAGYRHFVVPDWPAWVGVSIVLAVGALVSGMMVLNRLRQRRQAHRQPHADLAPQSVAPSKGIKESIQELRAQWTVAIRFLKRSRLKKQGNPLYVLPWHLVMGVPGSGKTTALRSAHLTSFADSRHLAGAIPTEHIEWSFFEQAIVIDTAGRFTDHQSSQANEEEWHVLLDLLLKSRRREPLNGLTLVLAADQLASGSSDVLEEMGKTLRKRINEILALVGYQLPIYLLVTKCDLIPGMAAFCKRFSKQGLGQAMGCLNDSKSSDAETFLENTFSVLGARLKCLRLILTGQSDPATMDPTILLFPETFGHLRSGLSSLLRGSFGENLYHETPLLSGLFFASGGQPDEAVNPPSTGMFLHEFFSKILTADRSAFLPTKRALRWRQGTMSLLAMSWVALSVALAGLLSYSFLQNMKTLNVLREAKQEYSGLAGLPEDFSSKVVSMDHFAGILLALDQKRAGFGIPGFGLRDVSGVEVSLKRMLSAQFRLEILDPLDEQTRAAMETLTAASPDDRFSRYIAHLVDRLGVLRAALDGADRQSFQKATPTFPYIRAAGREIDSDTKEKVGQLYVNSAFWMSNAAALNQERNLLQYQLKRLLNLKGRDPQWLIAWAALQQTTPPLMLHDEWSGHPMPGREPAVPGLFSLKGKVLIDAFFTEVESALNDSAVSGDLKVRFGHWYRQNAFDSWLQFVEVFPRGMETLGSRENWRSAAGRMTGEDGPYARLVKHISQQFAAIAETDLPPWVRHVRQIQALDRTPASWKYHQALDKLAKAVSDPSQVMATTAQAFDRSAAPGTSLFAVAFDSLATLKANAPKELTSDPAVWKLVSGPLDFLWEDARMETAQKLQDDWQSKVLAQATGLDAAQGLPVLLSKEGPAMQFVKEEANPFMEWRPSIGYGVKAAYEGTIPFNTAFFSFLNGAVWMSGITNLQVGITALTPETNPGAKRIPHIMRLTLQCPGKNQTLENRRLRVLESTFDTVEKNFTWTPACGETDVEMDLAGSHLTKSYPGAFGFFAFLHDFQSGKHAFTPHEFPDQAKALAGLKVTSIVVHYRLKGAPDYAAPKAAPAKIVRN